MTIRKSMFILILMLIILSISVPQKDIYIGSKKENTINDPYYGHLIIPEIDMNLGFYESDNKLNTVSKNVTLIPTGVNNTFLLAAHSGVGKVSFFNDLRYLSNGDDIYLKFKEYTNHYKVKEIRKEIKDGDISIKNIEGQLILTTCDQVIKGLQLIIEAELV